MLPSKERTALRGCPLPAFQRRVFQRISRLETRKSRLSTVWLSSLLSEWVIRFRGAQSFADSWSLRDMSELAAHGRLP